MCIHAVSFSFPHCLILCLWLDDNLSEDDINECEKEDPLREDDDVPHPDGGSKKKKKKKKLDIGMRWDGFKESCCAREESTVFPRSEKMKQRWNF